MQDRRFSHQRERIYAAVLNSHAHPTAEMVYQRLKPEKIGRASCRERV